MFKDTSFYQMPLNALLSLSINDEGFYFILREVRTILMFKSLQKRLCKLFILARVTLEN